MQMYLLLAIISAAATIVDATGDPPSMLQLDFEWANFKTSHGKRYASSPEETRRRNVWLSAREKITRHNAEAAKGLQTYTMAINHLSDLDQTEAEQLLGGKLPSNIRTVELNRETALPESRQTVPATFDLRNSPCMPAVKNQGSCGSCWAFAATAPVEYLTCKKTRTRTVLSESQLVDCSTANGGCNGGFFGYAWQYVINAPGLAKSSVLPYYPTNGTCKYNVSMKAATVVTYGRIANVTSEIMKALVTKGPLAVAMWVNTTTFGSYGSGVYTESTCPKDCVGKHTNHAVVLVGYGTSDTGIPYWVFRNSWGSNWGLNGYGLIQRGVNMCNIDCFPFYVSVGSNFIQGFGF